MRVPLLLRFISSLLGVTAFFFIARQIPWLSTVSFGETNTPFYLIFLLLGLAGMTLILTHSEKKIEKFIRTSLVFFLPLECVIVLGLFLSSHFHGLVSFSAGFYVFVTFLYWAFLTIGRERRQLSPPSLVSLKARIKTLGRSELIVGLLTLIFLFFGLTNLTHFAAVDEPLWMEDRIPKFWKNLLEGDLRKTNVSDKPGITVALLTGPGLFFADPKIYDDTRFVFSEKHPEANIESLYFAFRLPQLLAITLLLPCFYLFLVPLIGKRSALFSYCFIALSPILIGMSKIVNPDSLLWLFVPLSFLTYLCFLKEKKLSFLFFSAIFLGLALLTKYVANFLFVYFFGFIFFTYLYAPRETSRLLSHYIQEQLTYFGLWMGLGLSLFYLLLPAVWIEPQELFKGTLMSEAFEKVAPLFIVLTFLLLLDRSFFASRYTILLLKPFERLKNGLRVSLLSLFLATAGATLLNGFFHMRWFNFMEILASPKSISQIEGVLGMFLTNFFPLLFGLPLLTLVFFLGGIIMTFRKDKRETWEGFLIFSILLFILLYYVGSTVNEVVLINRYQIVLYPLAGILAGLGAEWFFSWLQSRVKFFSLWEERFPLAISLLTLILAFLLFRTPFPLSFASSLLSQQYTTDIKDMGGGSYEAAQYLNSLPEAHSLSIWTDKRGVCKFFVGNCTDGFDFKDLPLTELDYVVISSGRESRTERKTSNPYIMNDEGFVPFDIYYNKKEPVFEIHINNRPAQYVKVVPFET